MLQPHDESVSKSAVPVHFKDQELDSNDAEGIVTDKDGAQYPGPLRRAVITLGLALGTLLIAIDNTMLVKLPLRKYKMHLRM